MAIVKNLKGLENGAKALSESVGKSVAKKAATVAPVAQKATTAASTVVSKEASQAASTVGKSMVHTADNVTSKLSKLSIADFKAKGKFEKGKALLDGKGFTGQIDCGNGRVITYKDGLWTKSVGKDGIEKVIEREPGIIFVKSSDGRSAVITKNTVDIYGEGTAMQTAIYKNPEEKTISITKTQDWDYIPENYTVKADGTPISGFKTEGLDPVEGTVKSVKKAEGGKWVELKKAEPMSIYSDEFLNF